MTCPGCGAGTARVHEHRELFSRHTALRVLLKIPLPALAVPRMQEGKRASTTLERWQQVHDLRARNVGLLDCARRLGLSVAQHRQALRPGQRARAAAARPEVPAHPRRPLP